MIHLFSITSGSGKSLHFAQQIIASECNISHLDSVFFDKPDFSKTTQRSTAHNAKIIVNSACVRDQGLEPWTP